MREPLIVDTNVVLSAAIADAATRELVVTLDAALVAPAAMRAEIAAHEDMLVERSGLDRDELDALLGTLFEYITLVSGDAVRAHREPAREAMRDADPDDAVFVAAALARDGTVWSDDADLAHQDLVPVYTTQELVERRER